MEHTKDKTVPEWYEDWLKYMNEDDTRPSHTFIIQKAKQFPPGTPHGLNSLPYVLMPAVAFAMEEYAQIRVQALEELNEDLILETQVANTSIDLLSGQLKAAEEEKKELLEAMRNASGYVSSYIRAEFEAVIQKHTKP